MDHITIGKVEIKEIVLVELASLYFSGQFIQDHIVWVVQRSLHWLSLFYGQKKEVLNVVSYKSGPLSWRQNLQER